MCPEIRFIQRKSNFTIYPCRLCVFRLFCFVCHAEDRTQHAGLCTPALPLSHIPATAHDYDKEEFLVWFCFLVHSFPINILLNSTKAILYITWFLPKNNWMPSVLAYKRGTGSVILDLLPLWGYLKCFLKQIACGADLCQTLLLHIFPGLTPFPTPPKAWTCRLHSSARSLESVFLSLPLSTFISLLILSINCLTI